MPGSRPRSNCRGTGSRRSCSNSGALGIGASTRNGGSVSGGVNVGKSFTGRAADVDPERADRLLSDASDAFSLIERLIDEERIDCFWQKRGRFVGAWTPKHYAAQEKRLRSLNDAAQSGAYMVPRERQREEIASDYYHGGMVVERSASLHPALYYKGLLDACRRRDIAICAETAVEKIARNGAGWRVETSRGAVTAGDVVIATNGYTGAITPALAPPGRADRQPHHRDRDPAARTGRLADPEAAQHFRHEARPVLLPAVAGRVARRVRRPGAVHAVRSADLRAGPIRLHDRALSAARGTRVTHGWTGNTAFTFDALPHMGEEGGLHYALGCNGSGVAMMTYLGTQTARKIARVANAPCAFDTPDFPDHPLYTGNPWFLPVVGGWYRMRDRLDRMLA